MKKVALLVFLVLAFNLAFAFDEPHRTGLLYSDPRLHPELKQITSIPLEPGKSLLPAVDLSSEIPPVGNQGSQGSCVGWAIGYYHKTHTEYKEHGWNVALAQNQFSPAFVYNLINGGVDFGAYYIDAVKVLTEQGDANMSLCPYNQSDYTTWPSETAFIHALPYRGDAGYYIDCSNNAGIDLIKARLDNGYTVVLGIEVWSNFDYINNFDTCYCVTDKYGVDRGGHAITIVGYNDARTTSDGTGAFKLVNSWGTSWGHSGYGWMSYQAVKDPTLSHQEAYYITDRIGYTPTFRLRTKITHNARNHIRIRFGFGSNITPRYIKNFLDFFIYVTAFQSDQPFPNDTMVFDLSDSIHFLNPDSIIFLRCTDNESDGKTGTITYFSDELSRISLDLPVTIPDYNVAVYAQIPGILPLGRWLQKESMPSNDPKPNKYVKDGGALVKVGSELYVFRGNKSKEFYNYNSGIWTWLQKESIPYGVKPPPDNTTINKKTVGKGAALCWNNDSIIYATKGNSTWEFWAYNINESTWTQKAFVPSTQKLKGGTSIAYTDGKVYLLAGAQKKDNTRNFFTYNPTHDTWITLTGAPLTPPATGKAKPFKDGSCISIIGNTIYALKGGDKYNFFYLYDITGDTVNGTSWAEIESIPLIHPLLNKKNKVGDGGAMTTDGNILYVIKGKGKQDFWSYTPGAKGVWTSLDTIPRVGVAFKKSVPKTGAALAYANEKVWLLKGNKTPEFWCYAPSPGLLARTNSTSLSSVMTENNMPFIKFSFDVRPNPFTKHTTIRYAVPISGKVSLKLYNVIGRIITTLNDGYVNAGIYTTTLSTKTLAKGVYFLRYTNNTNQNEIKLIVQ